MNQTSTHIPDLGRSIFKTIFRLILGRDATAALIRFILLAALIAIHWVITIVGLRFPGEIPLFWLRSFPPVTYPILNIASTFFNPEVLLHLLPVLAGLVVGLVIAAWYLSDLFELERFEIAWRYLAGAIYGLSTPRLRVNSGEKANLDVNNPIRRVGGPGVIQTHLGYAAVFESLEGIPSIYGLVDNDGNGSGDSGLLQPSASPATHVLRGFERLRDVVDLRDRITKVDLITAETREGVVVVAQDAQMVFRVYGGDQERSLSNPYPFSEDAIRRIVYAQPVEEKRRRTPVDALKEIVRTEIRTFVGRYTLDEFLALQPYRRLEHRDEPNPAAQNRSQDLQTIQIPRRELTERFHTPQLHARLKDQGLELDWVGVGTWRVSEIWDDSDQDRADQTLIQAWRDSQRLSLYRSPDYINRQRQLAQRQLPNTLLTDWFEAWEAGELPQEYRCYELLTVIRRQLGQLMDRSDPSSERDSDLSVLRSHIDSLLDPQFLGGD